MSEREKTPDITSELNALADQVQQDREAGVFLQPPKDFYDEVTKVGPWKLIREQNERIAGMQTRLDHLEAENARLNDQHKTDNAMIRRVSERIESELTAATSRAEQAERERDEAKRSLKHEQAARLRAEDGR